MTEQKFSLVRGRRMRVTKLDGCGAVSLGPDSQIASKGFISVGLTANTEEGETISVTNAAGEVCILDEPAPKFTGYSITVSFCGVDPQLISLMTGQPVVLDGDDVVVGFGIDSDVTADDSGFALELWSAVPAGTCDDSGEASFGYFLIPFVKGGVLGDFTVENAAVNFTLTGASSKDGNVWGVGPYDVVRDAGGVESPLLTAIPDTRHLHMQLTTVPPPEPSDGATALGVPATGATAGTPATLTPSNSYAPFDLAEAIAGPFAATPTTAWTTGQYVRLRDGSTAHWDSTTWVAGVA